MSAPSRGFPRTARADNDHALTPERKDSVDGSSFFLRRGVWCLILFVVKVARVIIMRNFSVCLIYLVLYVMFHFILLFLRL